MESKPSGKKSNPKVKASSQDGKTPKIKDDDIKTVETVWDLVTVISEQLELKPWVVKNTVDLLDHGNTVPFIARYRQERTNHMEADKIRQLKEHMDSLRAVQQKIGTIINSMSKADQLTPKIEVAFKQAKTMAEVEHLYAPYKPSGKRTLAQRARDAGLEPLTMAVLNSPHTANLHGAVKPGTEGIGSIEDVEKGVQYIIADIISKDTEVMDAAWERCRNAHIRLQTCKSQAAGKMEKESLKGAHKSTADVKKVAKFSADIDKFEDYFNFNCNVHTLKPHQVLAINRGENLKVLSVKLVFPDSEKYHIENIARRKFLHHGSSGQLQKVVNAAVEDAYTRLIQPHMIRHIRSELTKTAEKASIDVFASNLKRLLMTPPVRGKVVLGLDPGFKSGTKVAVVSATSKILHTGVLHLHHRELQNQEVHKLRDILMKHRCETIALGNRTACRETEMLLSKHIQNGMFKPLSVVYCIVNEDGASIYSASDEAKKEMPDLDVSVRGAVSIGRRLQDPMAELIKIDPKHLGVGMYQHDLSESDLRTALDGVVEDCVSFVGVDLNVCSEPLLRRIAGLNKATSQKIIAWRDNQGAFINRQQLLQIKGVGQKSYEQCVGFIRVMPETRGSIAERSPQDGNHEEGIESAAPKARKRMAATAKTGGKAGKRAKMAANLEPNALDMTSIHPESYHIADRLLERLRLDKENIGQPGFTSAVKHFAETTAFRLIMFGTMVVCCAAIPRLADEYGTTPSTLTLILDGLKQPLGYDIRDEFEKPLFKQGLTNLSDLKQGCVLTGRVNNTTHFGAFVDVGVEREGLIHISKMPRTALCGKKCLELGDKVEVVVESVQIEKKRISLRLKKLL